MNKRLYYLELVLNCLLGLLEAILLPFGIKYIVNSGGYSFFIKMLILFAPIISVVSMLLIPFYGVKRFIYDYLSMFLVLIEVAILVFLGMLYVTTRLWYRIRIEEILIKLKLLLVLFANLTMVSYFWFDILYLMTKLQ